MFSHFFLNVSFPKVDAFDFSKGILISKICPFDSFSKCLIFKISKFAAFDFSYNIFDFQNLSRLISQMAFVFPKWERYGSHPRDSFWDRGHTQSTVTSRPNEAETECFSEKEGMYRWIGYGFKEPSREEKASHFFTLSPKREPFHRLQSTMEWTKTKQYMLLQCLLQKMLRSVPFEGFFHFFFEVLKPFDKYFLFQNMIAVLQISLGL